MSTRNPGCGTGVLVLRSRATGAIYSRPLFCKKWSCEACAQYKADAVLHHVQHCLHGTTHVWVALDGDVAKEVRSRVKKRRERVHKGTGDDVQYMVADSDGVVVVFATHELTGDEPPRYFMRVVAHCALMLLKRHGLKVPGVTRKPSFSRGWSETSCPLCRTRKSTNHRLRTFGRSADFDEAFEAFADAVEARTGVRPQPGDTPPPEVPLALWVELSDRYLGPHPESDDEWDLGHRFP
jgi:hypothetical protein